MIETQQDKQTDRPCWEQFGKGYMSPHKDPSVFVKSGCSVFGSCVCTAAERQEMVDKGLPKIGARVS